LIQIKDRPASAPQIADDGRSLSRGRMGREGSMADAPSRWPQFAWALRKQALMDEMMEAQGVDLLAAVKTGEAYVRARAECRDCDCEGACRDWFLEGESKQADFCPNDAFFAALRREK